MTKKKTPHPPSTPLTPQGVPAQPPPDNPQLRHDAEEGQQCSREMALERLKALEQMRQAEQRRQE